MLRQRLDLSMTEKSWPNWNFKKSFLRPPIVNAIHVWKDVAQLKLCDRPSIPQHLPDFYPCLKRRGPIETSPAELDMSSSVTYPCLKRRGPIETEHRCPPGIQEPTLSMSERTWPNWNSRLCNPCLYFPLLSMSERTWPNWNMNESSSFIGRNSAYPCLKGRGPIETITWW